MTRKGAPVPCSFGDPARFRDGQLAQLVEHYSNSVLVRNVSDGELEYANDAQGRIEFPRIVMIPPFRAVKKHLAAALSLLGRSGHDCATLVALVPITYEHEEAEELEELGRDTFPAAAVYTKIIRIAR